MRYRRPTSSDVARAAGVSRTTVSFVLNGRDEARISPETRRRVLEAAATLGYYVNGPARHLAAGAGRTLGLVVLQSAEHVAADALLPATLRGLTAAARAGDYRVLVEPLPPGDGSYEALLRSRHVDGLVISGPRGADPALERLNADGFPVIVQGHLDGSAIPSVDVDNRAAARTAVDYLVSLGHREIGCVTNAPLDYTSAAERLAGYREALAAHGLRARQSLIATGDYDAQSGHAAMHRLLRARVPPTAVFVASDVVAFGAYGALRDAGLRVPADVSIVGFDDIALATFADPPLTTISRPAFDLGHAAGRLLLDQLAGRSIPTRTLLATQLIVRASAGPPGGGYGARPAQGGP